MKPIIEETVDMALAEISLAAKNSLRRIILSDNLVYPRILYSVFLSYLGMGIEN